MLRILIVAKPGEPTSRLVAELGRTGFVCCLASSPQTAVEQADKSRPDVVLVDMNVVPDAERLCSFLRRDGKTPVLGMVPLETAFGIDGAVDDFVVTPVNPREVAARTRRLAARRPAGDSRAKVEASGIAIDAEEYKAYVRGRYVPLTFREFELLRFMAMNPGRVFTRDALLNRVWGEDYFGGDRTVDVHIRRLRSKIDDASHMYIETVRNMGYRFKRV